MSLNKKWSEMTTVSSVTPSAKLCILDIDKGILNNLLITPENLLLNKIDTMHVNNLYIDVKAQLPLATTIGTVLSTEISYLKGVTSSIQTQLNTKADAYVTEIRESLDIIYTTPLGDENSDSVFKVSRMALGASYDAMLINDYGNVSFYKNVYLPATTFIDNVLLSTAFTQTTANFIETQNVVQRKTESYSMTQADRTIAADAAGITITLPDDGLDRSGIKYTIIVGPSGSNINIHVVGTGDTINGVDRSSDTGTPLILVAPYDKVTITRSSLAWLIV